MERRKDATCPLPSPTFSLCYMLHLCFSFHIYSCVTVSLCVCSCCHFLPLLLFPFRLHLHLHFPSQFSFFLSVPLQNNSLHSFLLHINFSSSLVLSHPFWPAVLVYHRQTPNTAGRQYHIQYH